MVMGRWKSALTAIASAAMALAACVPAAPSPDNAASIREITAIEHEMAAAQGVDGVTRTWDDGMVWYEFAAEVHGGEEATALTAQQFTAIKNLRTRILRMTVHADGDMAYAYSVQNFVAESTAGGPELNFIFRETDIFERKDGEWRLVHQHLSAPVDLATGQAILTSRDSFASGGGDQPSP